MSIQYENSSSLSLNLFERSFRASIMSSTSEHSSGGLWHKFRSSTKSLSSSLSNLSMKTESEGDTPTSTVVHKSLVKFYKHQEPFTGFPGWLGHKEDLPNEQKILKKQNHVSSNPIAGGLNHMRKSSLDKMNRKSVSPSPFNEPEQLSSAGMAFHSIYSSETTTVRTSSTAALQGQAQHGRPDVLGRSDLQDQSQAPTTVTKNSSMMMRERLKRQNTKNSINIGRN